MASTNHPHSLKASDRSARRLHCLKTAGWPYDSFECAVIGLDVVVEAFAGTTLRMGGQLAFLLQTANGSRVRAVLVCRN